MTWAFIRRIRIHTDFCNGPLVFSFFLQGGLIRLVVHSLFQIHECVIQRCINCILWAKQVELAACSSQFSPKLLSQRELRQDTHLSPSYRPVFQPPIWAYPQFKMSLRFYSRAQSCIHIPEADGHRGLWCTVQYTARSGNRALGIFTAVGCARFTAWKYSSGNFLPYTIAHAIESTKNSDSSVLNLIQEKGIWSYQWRAARVVFPLKLCIRPHLSQHGYTSLNGLVLIV